MTTRGIEWREQDILVLHLLMLSYRTEGKDTFAKMIGHSQFSR